MTDQAETRHTSCNALPSYARLLTKKKTNK